MERYFAKRTEGDFTETQRIKAEVGHAELARQAFGECVREYGIKDGRSFFTALKELLKELGKAGYTERPEGWKVTGGKFLPFERMTHRQLYATWASVQQTVGKWIYEVLPGNCDLWLPVVEKDLVFKANDVSAVMHLLFDLLYRPGLKMFAVDTEQGMNKLETKVLACLSK